jgi:hypothetical protein
MWCIERDEDPLACFDALLLFALDGRAELFFVELFFAAALERVALELLWVVLVGIGVLSVD